MLASELPTCWLSVDTLVKEFYNSFTDEENFVGDETTLAFAQEIVSRGDAMWNHPMTAEDAELFIDTWNETH